MGRINYGRMILGGIVAGIVINVSEFLLNGVVLSKDLVAAMAALGKQDAMGPNQMTIWIAYGFILGIATIWLYAAIRPRYGPGGKTAFRAGLAVWFLAYFLSAVANGNLGLFPTRLLAISTVWGLVELPIAAAIGAYFYREP